MSNDTIRQEVDRLVAELVEVRAGAPPSMYESHDLLRVVLERKEAICSNEHIERHYCDMLVHLDVLRARHIEDNLTHTTGDEECAECLFLFSTQHSIARFLQIRKESTVYLSQCNKLLLQIREEIYNRKNGKDNKEETEEEKKEEEERGMTSETGQ